MGFIPRSGIGPASTIETLTLHGLETEPAPVPTTFEPGATPQLVQLQAPGRPRVDILVAALPVDITVPEPIETDVEVAALVVLDLPIAITVEDLSADGDRVLAHLAPSYRLGATISEPAPTVTAEMQTREWGSLAGPLDRLDAAIREHEELTMLGVL
jgi:hypothetical protein